jgi:hypothetical protein
MTRFKLAVIVLALLALPGCGIWPSAARDPDLRRLDDEWKAAHPEWQGPAPGII